MAKLRALSGIIDSTPSDDSRRSTGPRGRGAKGHTRCRCVPARPTHGAPPVVGLSQSLYPSRNYAEILCRCNQYSHESSDFWVLEGLRYLSLSKYGATSRPIEQANSQRIQLF